MVNTYKKIKSAFALKLPLFTLFPPVWKIQVFGIVLSLNTHRHATCGEKEKNSHFLELQLTKQENDSLPFPVNMSFFSFH